MGAGEPEAPMRFSDDFFIEDIEVFQAFVFVHIQIE